MDFNGLYCLVSYSLWLLVSVRMILILLQVDQRLDSLKDQTNPMILLFPRNSIISSHISVAVNI